MQMKLLPWMTLISDSEFTNMTLFPLVDWAQQRSPQLSPAVWKSPTCGTPVVLVLIMLTAMQASLTAVPKGLQGSHYTLRFYCKPGNKEPVSCCSKTAPLPSMFKKHFVPFLCCPLSSLSKIEWTCDWFANWHTCTIKIVLWYCKLCICSCFDSVLMFCRRLRYMIAKLFPIPLRSFQVKRCAYDSYSLWSRKYVPNIHITKESCYEWLVVYVN